MNFLKSKKNYLAIFCSMFALVAMVLVGCQKDTSVNDALTAQLDEKVNVDDLGLEERAGCSNSTCPVTVNQGTYAEVCCGGALLICEEWKCIDSNEIVICNCFDGNEACRTSGTAFNDMKALSTFMATEMGAYGKDLVATVVAYQSELLELLGEDADMESSVNIAVSKLINKVSSIDGGLFSAEVNYKFTNEDVALINDFLTELSIVASTSELKNEVNKLMQRTEILKGKNVKVALKELSSIETK